VRTNPRRKSKPPVLAIAAVPGKALGLLGEPSAASPAAWAHRTG
jgi:hypothetical protein